MEKEDLRTGNEPAYPMDFSNEGYSMQSGLTKREYFAGLAMQGLCASPRITTGGDALAVPELALVIADALLKELEK